VTSLSVMLFCQFTLFHMFSVGLWSQQSERECTVLPTRNGVCSLVQSKVFILSIPRLDARPLSPAAQQHFLANRFLCRVCNTNFCKSCLVTPYHLGFTCQLYQVRSCSLVSIILTLLPCQEYKNAPKCRFCGTAATPDNKIAGPLSMIAAFRNKV